MPRRRTPGKRGNGTKGNQGRNPSPSKKVRKRVPVKHISPRETRGRIALEDQLYTARERARRYAGVESVLNLLKLNHPLKRQAVHAACETAAQEMRDIVDQYQEIEIREKAATFRVELRKHPHDYGKKQYAALCRTYNVRPTDSLETLSDQARFLQKHLQKTTRMLRATYETPPHEIEKIFGKKSAPALWKILRKEVFPGKLLL